MNKTGSFTCEGVMGKNNLYAKVKSEYGSHLAKIITEAKFDFNSVTGKGELTFKCGWKFSNCSYDIKPPSTHVFSFFPQSVKMDGLSGKVTPVAEITTNNEFDPKVSVLVPFRLTDSNLVFEIKPDASKNTAILVGGAAAFWYALQAAEAATLLLL